MSLLTSTNLANPDNAHWVANDGTTDAPVISGNPVQLCTGGPVVSSAGAVESITATGAGSVLRLGNAGLANCMSFGPGQAATLTSQVTMIPNSNLQVGQFTQIIVNPDPTIGPGAGSGLLTVNTGGRLEVASGGIVDFNNVGAPRGTFRATTALPTPIPDATTQILANPPLIIEGTYAVMLSSPAGDGQQTRQIATVAYWTGLVWLGGSCIEQNNLSIVPSADRSSLNLVNSTGGPLTNMSVSFVQLVGGVGV